MNFDKKKITDSMISSEVGNIVPEKRCFVSLRKHYFLLLIFYYSKTIETRCTQVRMFVNKHGKSGFQCKSSIEVEVEMQ